MFDRIKNFVAKHDVAIALTIYGTAGVLVGAWTVHSAMRGGANVHLPKAAVNDLLAGKDVLLDCLDDAYLLIKYIPKA